MTGADALEPFPQSAVAGTTRRFPGMVVVLDKPIDYMTAWKLQTQLHAERVRDQRPGHGPDSGTPACLYPGTSHRSFALGRQ